MGRGKSFFKKAKKKGPKKGRKRKADAEDLHEAKLQKKKLELERLWI